MNNSLFKTDIEKPYINVMKLGNFWIISRAIEIFNMNSKINKKELKSFLKQKCVCNKNEPLWESKFEKTRKISWKRVLCMINLHQNSVSNLHIMILIFLLLSTLLQQNSSRFITIYKQQNSAQLHCRCKMYVCFITEKIDSVTYIMLDFQYVKKNF